MKSFAVLLTLILHSFVLAKQRPRDSQAHGFYSSRQAMKRMMATKETAWKRGGETGVLAPGNFSSVNQHHACDKGHIVMNMNGVPHTFQCKNLDITGHLTHTDLGSNVTTPYVGM